MMMTKVENGKKRKGKISIDEKFNYFFFFFYKMLYKPTYLVNINLESAQKELCRIKAMCK